MKKIVLLLLAFSLISCAHGKNNRVMTMQKFQSAQIGMTESDLLKTYGNPRNIYHRDDGTVIYEYMEQFQSGYASNTIIEIRRYYFVLKDGKIISKRIGIRNQPAYEPMDNVNPTLN